MSTKLIMLEHALIYHNNTGTCSTWMDGPMSGVDPDVVENDIGVVWRTLYKLEKGFAENPSALKMAQKVKGRVDDFKEYSGLIGALFNPGLRDRHWEKMSQIANQDLKPTEVDFCIDMHMYALIVIMYYVFVGLMSSQVHRDEPGV